MKYPITNVYEVFVLHFLPLAIASQGALHRRAKCEGSRCVRGTRRARKGREAARGRVNIPQFLPVQTTLSDRGMSQPRPAPVRRGRRAGLAGVKLGAPVSAPACPTARFDPSGQAGASVAPGGGAEDRLIPRNPSEKSGQRLLVLIVLIVQAEIGLCFQEYGCLSVRFRAGTVRFRAGTVRFRARTSRLTGAILAPLDRTYGKNTRRGRRSRL